MSLSSWLTIHYGARFDIGAQAGFSELSKWKLNILNVMYRKKIQSLIYGKHILSGFLILLALTEPMSAQHPTTIQLTKTDSTEQLDTLISRPRQWGLDEQEWQRYQTLMQGIRGSVSPKTLSPVEVLGIHARNESERKRYARLWASMMREDAERILAFQRAYDEAQQQLFGGDILIDTGLLISDEFPKSTDVQDASTLQAGDRILLFTATDCPVCDAVLERLLGRLSLLSGIDLYLMDVSAGEESRIREWARRRLIDPDRVNEQTLTLNINGGALERVITHTGQVATALPLLALRRGDQLLPLSAGNL